jgi:HNH endonuclease
MFHLDQYAIVPSFQDWEFPHDQLPKLWPQVPTLPATRRCSISNFTFAVDSAHLMPQEEAVWYQRNDMARYGDAILGDMNNPANVIPLKSDLHTCFDNRWFAIIPKVTEPKTTAQSPQYVTHILRRHAAELWPTFHNIIVENLHSTARPYPFARFAWAILLHVKLFVTAGFTRHAIRIRLSGEDKIGYTRERLSGPQLQIYYGGGGSKRATPKDKTLGTGSGADDSDSGVDSDSNQEDVTTDLHQWEIREESRYPP